MTISTPLRLFLLLLIIAAVSWSIMDISTSNQEKQPPSNQQLDFYAKGINTLQTDSQGLPQNRLIASTLLHFEKSDESQLENPTTTLYEAGAATWVIKADHGIVTAKGEKIILQKNVSIHRPGDKETTEIIITTESLILEPNKNHAETKAPIRFVSGNNIINAVGMKGQIKKPIKIELLSKVRGEYEAP
jgi:lipopolysaccharide export system protein LptC